MRSTTDYDSIDDVEAELQKLTEEVRRLRLQQSSESDKDSWVAVSPPDDQAVFLEPDKDMDTPAQRLMKAHEQQIKGVKSHQLKRAQASPAVHEFPALATLTNSSRTQGTSTEKPRKPSYAQILADHSDAGDSDGESSVRRYNLSTGNRVQTCRERKNVTENGKQMAVTLGSKSAGYALPTAASKRRAAATGSASPVSPVSHKPARSIPSVRTLWQDRDVDPKPSGGAHSSPTAGSDKRRLALKTALGVAHDPAIVNFKETRTDTPDHAASTSPSRLPRPVKRDENVDNSTELLPPIKLMVRQEPAVRKFSRAELLAIKAVDDEAKREEIINKISSSEVPDLVAHEKGSARGSENTKSNQPRRLNSYFQTATTQARSAVKRGPDGVASLRAEAPDFVPTPGRTTSRVVLEPSFYNQQDPLWVPDYTWESMSHDQKLEVVENRRGRGLSNVSSTDPGTFSTSSPTQVSSPIVLDPQGNVLSPKPKWTWANRRTVKTLRTLGRAPLPTSHLPATGSGSDSSEGSSPLKAWTVGPDRPGSWYGWSGGDGKEISFRGYGAHAERNAYSPHNFRSYENQSTSNFGFTNQGYGHLGCGGNNQAPPALQDWAQQRGYDRVPCPNYQIGRATENITTPENPLGWCSTCLSHRTGLGAVL
ncbi:hypothetical protein MBLNU457_3095t1 [Dothideomycetes sp. NU457]